MSTFNRRIWPVCVGIVLWVLIVTYSPIVLKPHTVEPWRFGLPYTLWATLISAFLIVIVTAIGAFFRPSGESDLKIDKPAADD